MSDTTLAPVIEVAHLSRKFHRKLALDDVSLSVPRGCVYGLLGENGAGKTTLIQHILGSYVAKSGQVRVLGMDPVKQPVEVLARVGYLSEDREIPGWMRVAELLRFTAAFYPNWDHAYAGELQSAFRLDPQAKVRTLSRGERAKAGLILALAHRPEILVLDEPSSGLDAIVRKDILGAIVRTVADEGRTVFFSSHLIDEVERVSDYVAILARGKVVLSSPMDTLKATHARLTLRYAAPQSTAPTLPGALSCEGLGREWTVLCNGQRDAVLQYARATGAELVEEAVPTLEEVFVARCKAAAV